MQSNFPEHPPAVVISGIEPAVDGGRYPVKRVVGEPLEVWATVFKDGHDLISVVLLWRREEKGEWSEVPMRDLGNDRWGGEFTPDQEGLYEYTVAAWPDREGTWLDEFRKKTAAGEGDLAVEREEGAIWLREASLRARQAGDVVAARDMMQMAMLLPTLDPAEALELMEGEGARALARRWGDRRLLTVPEQAHPLLVESRLAGFSAWYEFFPRNARGDGKTPATLRECTRVLHHAKALGFDVVYLPPVHPIGLSFRKGKNNATTCEPGDIGSPWAIGGEAGGHRDIDPALGTMEDFRGFVEEARALGLETAMDFALQCSPDHPWVREHPEWFHHRPDGSIKYAENPPKKYQDIYPLHFHNANWRGLWQEILDTLLFWCGQGVRVFRVDNPHTKPVAMWEWVLREVRRKFPEAVFLSEAFTRPAMMRHLAKIGFSQSYSYFTWRTGKEELQQYVRELEEWPVRQYMRANFWPNTPDILAYELWNAPPAKFGIRATLAATLMPNWGIYSGYEFVENKPLPPKEEYLDSEKYQLRERDLSAPGITVHISALNAVRRAQPALQERGRVVFGETGHEQVMAYARVGPEGDRLLVVVTLDAENAVECMVTPPLDALGVAPGESFAVEDLLTGETWTWQGGGNYVKLDPTERVAHVFRIVQ